MTGRGMFDALSERATEVLELCGDGEICDLDAALLSLAVSRAMMDRSIAGLFKQPFVSVGLVSHKELLQIVSKLVRFAYFAGYSASDDGASSKPTGGQNVDFRNETQGDDLAWWVKGV